MARRGADPSRKRSARKEPADASRASRQGRPRGAIAGAAAALAAVVLAAGLYVGGPGPERTEPLPPLPDLSSRTDAVGDHLRDRHAAAERVPRSPDALGALCVALHADMMFDEADACYARVAAIDSGNWRWTYFRALIQADRGGGERLVEHLRQTVARAPDFSPAWLRLGDAEFKAGRYDLAAEAWDRAARLPEPERGHADPPHRVEAPVVAYAVTGLARIALARGEARRAADLLEDVTNGAPAFTIAHRLLADALDALGRAEEAAQARERARRLSPFAPYADPFVDELARESRNSTFLMRLASEADLSVNAAWSEHLSRRAVEFEPDNPEAVSKLARVLRTLGRSAEALPYFQRYHDMVPGDFEGLAQLGSCLSDLGRFAEAEPMLRRALEGMDDAVTRYNLGLLLARTGRLDEAIAEYERALARDPNHVNARINLATVLARRGELGRAARELARAVEQEPGNALGHANLGLVLAQQGDTARAARALEEALRLDPGLTAAADALRALRP